MKRSALAFVLLAGALAAADYAAEGDRWWSHVLYLADDKLEGRDTGTPGHRKAAEYVAAQFERAGLKPAGTHAYFQPIELVSRSIDEPHSSLELLTQTGPVGLKLGEDALISMRGEPAAHTEAEAVFVGYGMKIPELNYDDLRGIDLHGKIAVYLYAAPKSVPGPLAAHMASERWKTSAAR